MTAHLAETCCARLPAEALRHLGALRACAELAGFVDGEALWLFWPVGDSELAQAILAVGGAELFVRRGANWHRPGEHLPVFFVPGERRARPLSALLFPAPVMPVPACAVECRPAPLLLVRCGVARSATALLLDQRELVRWAENATTHQLDRVLAACCGERVLLRGALPVLPGERFWGRRVLLPLGQRIEPELAEGILLAGLGLQDGDFALWTAKGVEIIGAEAFGPVTRAGLRRAGEGIHP